MKAFLQALTHAAIGGFAAGVASQASGASWKSILFAGLASALTSVFSVRAQPK